ncbi:MAG: hypothetical protein HY270_12490 [Deltaproteobacteria bacterium]|nr:hypothetical protein [Deltaproteobacteria bacterium]
MVALLLSLSLLATPGVAATPKKTAAPAKKATKATPGKKGKAKPVEKSAEGRLQKEIWGKWKQIGGEDEVEFTKAGMMIATNSSIRLEGAYTIRAGGKLEMDLGLNNLTHGPIVRKLTLQGDELTLVDEPTGLVMKYKRVKK